MKTWHAEKASPRRNFIVVNAYIRKKEISNKPNFTHHGTRKRKRKKPKGSGKKNIKKKILKQNAEYTQNTYLIKDLYPEYIKKLYWKKNFLNGQNT